MRHRNRKKSDEREQGWRSVGATSLPSEPGRGSLELSLSRSVVFDLMRMGRIRSVKEGRTRLIPMSALQDYIALLELERESA